VIAERAEARPVRWPWFVLAVAVAAACAGMALVVANDRSIAPEFANFAAFMGMGVVGALILARTPRHAIGSILLSTATIVGCAFVATEAATFFFRQGSSELARWLAWPANTLWTLGIFPLLVLLPLLFPDGRLVSPRWRIVLWVGLALIAVAFVTLGFGVPTLEVDSSAAGTRTIPNPLHMPPLAFLEVLGVSLGDADGVVSGLVFLGIPIAVGVAVLRYRLWDLDVVVKKTVVAGLLVLLAVVAYAVAVVLIPTVIEFENPVALFVVALGLGIAFRPAMRSARRVADRLVYGRRATPYEVLTEFSERLGTSYGTEDVLPRMAQILAEGTGAEAARVWLHVGGSFQPASVWPAGAGTVPPAPSGGPLEVAGETVVEVRDRGEVLGALSVRMPAADPMSPAKEKLIRDLAAQAGLVLRNVRLVEDLRTSRQRLVAAQDMERRRLERDIHDGAQQQLVALTVKARLARQVLERDPAKAADLLGQIEAETQTALEDLRDLARGIYPPLLADAGLVKALESQSRKAPVRVTLEAEGVGRHSAEIEATVYFCALEALQNVAKYAGTEHATVRLAQSNGTLSFSVVDEGRGFDPQAVRSGSGLQGMADRLAAVGGSLDVRSSEGAGTTVNGLVPVTAA
jgi:signal transduction histidine kinase